MGHATGLRGTGCRTVIEAVASLRRSGQEAVSVVGALMVIAGRLSGRWRAPQQSGGENESLHEEWGR